MDARTFEVTVKVAVPVIPVVGSVAVIEMGPPGDREVAIPLEPDVLLTIATAVFNELQATEDVRLLVVPSEYMPVAVNCWVAPRVIVALVGMTARDTRFGDIGGKIVELLEEMAVGLGVIVAVPPAVIPLNIC